MLEAYPKKAPSADYVLSTYQHMQTLMAPRNTEYQVLRKVFDGDFVSIQQSKALGDQQLAERVKLIYNICNATVRRYMDQLSAPPRIECVPRGWEVADLELADKRTKFCEHVWEANNFDVKLMQAGFYQSLLDNAVWHVRPNPMGDCKIKLELGVPDFYYPVVATDDWNDVRGVIYAFRKYKDGDYGKLDPMRAPDETSLGSHSETVVEWWDRRYYMRFINGRIVAQAEHGLGVIPWHKADNIPIPHRFRGQGDVDQAIGLNEYLNMLMSDMADMINYAANPIAVVRGTKAGGTNLPFAPRAVWELERDAQVAFLQWTGAPPSVEAQLIRSIQAIEDSTGVSSPAFGREIPSGTSGSAVRSLMAGFNTRLGTKQQLMGRALISVNETICRMAEVMFPDWEIPVIGEVQVGQHRGSPKEYTVKPGEFKGWYKNRVIFPPSDPTATYFQEMDKQAKGIQSRETTMRNLGIKNVWDELSRIKMERMEDAEHANNMGLAQQGQFVSPQQRQQQDADFAGAIEQLKGVMGANPKGTEQKQQREDVEAAAAKPTGTGVPSELPQLVGPTGPTPPAGPEETVNISDVMQALKRAANVSGRAALVGDITKTGAAGRFTIALENPQDAQAIKLALGPLASKADFQPSDFTKPLPEDSVEFTDPSKRGQKKKITAGQGTEIRKLSKVLQAVVLQAEKTNTGAVIYRLGMLDDKGSVVQVGTTQPQMRKAAGQGELINVHIDGISRRDDAGTIRWGLVTPTAVGGSAPARPSSFRDIERAFEKGRAS